MTVPTGYKVVPVRDIDGDDDDLEFWTEVIGWEPEFVLVPQDLPADETGQVEVKFLGSQAYVFARRQEELWWQMADYTASMGRTPEESVANHREGGVWYDSGSMVEVLDGSH